jgi:hypothetical protein
VHVYCQPGASGIAAEHTEFARFPGIGSRQVQ